MSRRRGADDDRAVVATGECLQPIRSELDSVSVGDRAPELLIGVARGDLGTASLKKTAQMTLADTPTADKQDAVKRSFLGFGILR